MPDLDIYKQDSGLDNLKELIIKHGERIEYKKKEFFVKAGEVCNEIAYIKRGGFKYTCYNSAGKERILSFAFEDEFVACYAPARNQSPALLNIQALEDSIVMRISMDKIASFFEVTIDGQTYVRKFVDTLTFTLLEKLISLHQDTPEERYFRLQERLPDILNRVNLKDIALYVGITSETLSRIRTRYLKENSNLS